MANFDQNVTINLDVNTTGISSKLGAAATKIEGLQQSIEGLDTDFDSAADSLQNFADAGSGDITPNLDLDGIKDEMDTFSEFADSLETVAEKKEEVSNSNKILSERNDDTSESATEEAKSFETLMESAESLSDAKSAVTQANDVLDDQNEKTRRSILKEQLNMDALKESGLDVDQMIDSLLDSQKELSQQEKDSAAAADIETRSFEEMIDSADTLAEAKHAVSNANKKVQGDADKSREELIREKVAAGELGEEALELADTLEETSKKSDRNRSSFRRMANAVDESGDSMRAANKVGNLFEDGLGSLSVNLGAFTVALRNFLTQVPLLLAALGSLGSAAVGVAGSFITLGGAIGSVAGAGAIAMAQNLDEEYSQLEGTGEALQMILLGLRDMFLQAISPLVENQQSVEIFRQIMVGLAEDVSLVADTLNELMVAQSDWRDGVLGISGVVDQLGEELVAPFERLVSALSFMFLNLQDEFIDMMVGMVDATAGLIRFTTIFADGITEDTRALDQFIDSLEEMASIGAKIFNGLEPLLMAFSSGLERVASVINSMNDEFVASIITFGLIIGAVNRFGGVIASIIGLIPNLVFGLKNANGSVLAMSKSLAGFTKQHSTLFGGFTSLAEAVEDFGDEMAVLSARTKITEDTFESIGETEALLLRTTLKTADSMEEFEDELLNVAMTSELSEENIDDLNDELEQMGISARIAEDGLDELSESNVDPDIDVARKKGLRDVGGGLAGGLLAGGALETAGDQLDKVKGTLKDSKIEATTASTKFGALKGAVGALIAPVSKLVGGFSLLNPVVLGVVALIGGVLVGVIGNLDKIMSGLSGTVEVLGQVMRYLVSQVMKIFIATWNALVDVFAGVMAIIKPFIDLFRLFGGNAESAGSAIDVLVGSLTFLVDLTVAVIDVIGGLTRVMATITGAFIEFGVFIASVIIVSVTQLIDMVIELARSFGFIDDAITFTTNKFNGFIQTIKGVISWIQQIPKNTQKYMNATIKFFQRAFNTIIEQINKFARRSNEVFGTNLQTLDKIDVGVSGDTGLRVDRDEVGAGTDSIMDSLTGSRDKSVILNEDKSTNLNQTVNADPEDKSQISRVVKDAMEEADSFSRRRNGFTGN